MPPRSGAHVTLDDLEKLAELREAADPVYQPRPQPRRRDGEKISGWVGTPDPAKFVQGTNALTVSEVEEEVRKGNVVMLDDWVGSVERLELWEKKLLFQSMLTDWMQSRFFVRTEGGKKVSFWDLYNYVYHNPELAALARSRHGSMPSTAAAAASGAGAFQPQAPDGGGAVPPGYIAPGLYGDPGPGPWRALDKESAKQMPWAIAGIGQLWRRRPTRWVWGVDGLKDADVAVYVHEERANELLGPKYGGRDPREVSADEEYAKDIMRAGPEMGMSFMITAARDVPAAEAADALVSRLARRMERRYATAAAAAAPPSRPLPPAGAATPSSPDAHPAAALPARYDSALGALLELYGMLQPPRLAEATRLLDDAGARVRPGASLLMCTGPGGKVMLQGISPGAAREREAYVLGAVKDAELCASLVEEFLGEGGPDAHLTSTIKTHMLMYANGFRAGNTNNSPLMRRAGEGPGFGVELVPARPSVFRLPRVGAARSGGVAGGRTPPTLLSGVRERQLVGAIGDLYQRAFAAAVSVAPATPGADDDAVAAVRRETASAVLREGLASLGLSMQGLGCGSGETPGEQLFADAEPLDGDELAEALGALRAEGDGPAADRNLRRGHFATSSCGR